MKPAPTSSIISVRGLRKEYDQVVLPGLDVDIAQGQFVAVMGPSGSGKSTLLHCVSGMERASAGRVTICGTELTGLDERDLAAVRLGLFGFVFQQPHLLATLTLLDNIVLPGFLARRRPRSEVVARGRELMAQMGISDLADKMISQASGGQLQRAGICRALINQPLVIFADEPTGALNSTTAAQILEVFGQIHRQGATIVMVTHDARVAARADRVLVLVDGQIADDIDLSGHADVMDTARLDTVSAAMTAHAV